MTKFRFEDLEIWKEAIDICIIFDQIASALEEKKRFRYADQLRGVGMSVPNNIAESTGTQMRGEQIQLLRFAHRECFEGANILIILHKLDLISFASKEDLVERLDILSRRISAYSRSFK
ncbi:MAG: four helix bundle protein [Saprospiraceae bacterium]|nr:four helix bundle protein [Saprospiraceae bacterium]